MQHPDQDCSLGDVVNEDSSPTPRETDSVSTTDIDEAFAGLTVPTPSPSIAMFAATLIPNLAEYTGPSNQCHENVPKADDAKARRRQRGRKPAIRLTRKRSLSDIVVLLTGVEKLCNELRFRVLDECRSVKENLEETSLIFSLKVLELEPSTQIKELYPASMNDIHIWNTRELRICLEWAKTFETFWKLSEPDQFFLVRNFAFTFNLLNRVFYSLDYGPDKIVYPNGAFILRHPQESVRIPVCRSTYHREMDEIMIPFRELLLEVVEFAIFKATLFFNPGL